MLGKGDAPRLLREAQATGRVFRLRRGWRAFAVAAGILFVISGALTVLLFPPEASSDYWIVAGFAVAWVWVGALCVSLGYRSLIAVAAEGVVIRGGGVRVLSWADLAGAEDATLDFRVMREPIWVYRKGGTWLPWQITFTRYERTDELTELVVAGVQAAVGVPISLGAATPDDPPPVG